MLCPLSYAPLRPPCPLLVMEPMDTYLHVPQPTPQLTHTLRLPLLRPQAPPAAAGDGADGHLPGQTHGSHTRKDHDPGKGAEGEGAKGRVVGRWEKART